MKSAANIDARQNSGDEVPCPRRNSVEIDKAGHWSAVECTLNIRTSHKTDIIEYRYYGCNSQTLATSNMTSVIEVRSASARLFASTFRSLVSVITTLYYVATIIFHRRVVSRAVSALCVYSKFGHHPQSYIGYLCDKFRFFRGLHC